MGNVIEAFNQGYRGELRGIPYGDGLESLTRDTNGITRRKLIGVAGPEKSGKTTFVDYAFVIQTYLYALENNIPVTWVYYSFEIDRISKEFDFMAYFLHRDYGIDAIQLPEGQLKDNKNVVDLCSDYLKGIMMDDNYNRIIVSEDLIEPIASVYEKYIIPLFGEYDSEGKKITNGLIDFRERRINPTGIYKDLIKIAEKEGRIIKKGDDVTGYFPNNPESFKIVIVDHIRKTKLERGWQLKQTIDKLSEYMVELRDTLGYTFVPLLHTNRNLGAIDRIKSTKDDIYPTNDDLKDSGNLGEDCNYLFTIFNPNDDKFGLKQHFGEPVRDSRGNVINKNFKTIHLVSSRHCTFPKHYGVNMLGNIKKFTKIDI